MNNLHERIAALSPKQRALFEAQLQKKGLCAPQTHAIERSDRPGPFPLSVEQEHLWFIHQLDPDSYAYNITTSQYFRGPLDVRLLERCFNEIIARHEAFRTLLPSEDGIPFQVITPPRSFSLPLVSLEAVPAASREAELERSVANFVRRPFDLAAGPLWRMTLFRLGEGEHVVLLTMHHIITDRWSMGLLWQELTKLYEAYSAGRPATLPAPPIRFVDFALWQRGWMQTEAARAQLAYWKRQLAGAPPALELPTDRPRPAVQTFRGKRQYWSPPLEFWEEVRALCHREGVTMYMAILAVFNILLHRYTGEEDISVGTPFSMRNHVETEGIIGYFLNMIVLRSRLSGNPTARELTQRAREVSVGAFANNEIPFGEIVQKLSTKRDASRNPFFQVGFILVDMQDKVAAQVEDFSTTALEVPLGASIFDLTLGLRDNQHPKIIFEYNTDLFDDSTITRMMGHFKTLLESVVADPEQRLATLALLPPAEQQLLLEGWNDTARAYPDGVCVHELFEAQVEKTPDSVALVHLDQRLTYRELNERANRLAHHLIALGVLPEDRVGVLLERSPAMVVALLAVLKAGGAYVPLDPAYPAQRLAFMLADSGAKLLITERRLRDLLSASPPVPAVLVEGEAERLAHYGTMNPRGRVTSANLAYVVYTSGSTGTPKGVLGLHRGCVNRFEWMWERYPFERDEVCCQKTSLSFLDSVWEIFGPLLKGITLALIPDEVVKDPARLIEELAARAVTRIVLVPSLLRAMLPAADGARLPRLRYWVSSGEALSAELAAQFSERAGGRRLINLYGSSEVSADVTCYEVPARPASRSVPIGRPIANTSAYILDKELRPVPAGVGGELYIAGDGLARGYLNRPAQTAEKFVPHPFSREPGARLYRTGDLARYLADGEIEYLGRVDHQMKVRGFRIEPGEVEAALAAHPAVREAVATAHADETGDKRLVAYFVPARAEDVPGLSGLRQFLKERLPEYMVPSLFVKLDELPLNPNGKVDRTALPAPDQSRPDSAAEYAAPATAVEQVLADIWCKVLGLERVGTRDDFFDLGGHSLLVTRLLSQVREVFGVEVSLREVFAEPTVAALASLIEELLITEIDGLSEETAEQLL